MKYNYYKSQLEMLQPDEFAVTIQLHDFTGARTNHLSLNKESIPILIEWLEKYEYAKQRIYLEELIDGKPADEKLLRKEYKELTGKNYRRV